MESWTVLVFLLPGIHWIKHCVKCVALLKRFLIFLVWLSSSDWMSGVHPPYDWIFDHSVTSLCWSWAPHSHAAFSQGPVLPGAPYLIRVSVSIRALRSHTFNCCFTRSRQVQHSLWDFVKVTFKTVWLCIYLWSFWFTILNSVSFYV